MKKFLALLLAMLMVLSLAACSGGDKDSAPDDSPTPASPSPSQDAVTPSDDNTSPSDNDTDDENNSVSGLLIGSNEWYDKDTYDHSSREPFKIAYVCNFLTWVWNKQIDETLAKLGEKLNFEYTSYAANGDFDAYVNQIYTFADQGYQGFILGTDDDLAPRVYEVCQELEVAFIAESTRFQDDSGKCIWPCVTQAQYENGYKSSKWLVDNYSNYWDEEVDPTKIGCIDLNYSTVISINDREPGVKDGFLEAFPEAEANYFNGDLVAFGSTGFSVQGGYDMTTNTISAHPEIEKWLIVANVDDWATGATRAVEAMNREEDVLVCSIQADAFLNEMNGGYTGNVFVASCAVSSTEFAKLMAANLVTILEGRETAESIWPEWQANEGEYANVEVGGDIITRDTYKDYVAKQVV